MASQPSPTADPPAATSGTDPPAEAATSAAPPGSDRRADRTGDPGGVLKHQGSGRCSEQALCRPSGMRSQTSIGGHRSWWTCDWVGSVSRVSASGCKVRCGWQRFRRRISKNALRAHRACSHRGRSIEPAPLLSLGNGTDAGSTGMCRSPAGSWPVDFQLRWQAGSLRGLGVGRPWL